jgi:hypothetical protein
VRTYDLSGRVRADRSAGEISVASGAATPALTLPPGPPDSPVFFVRCELLDDGGRVVAENVYWQSQVPDDVGQAFNDNAFETTQISYADMTALNTMTRPKLNVTAERDGDGPDLRARRTACRQGRRGDPADRVRRQLRHRVPRRDGPHPRAGPRAGRAARTTAVLGTRHRLRRHPGRRAGGLTRTEHDRVRARWLTVMSAR